MRFTLRPRDGSATFQKITTGKKWVGRVGQCEDGRCFGKIGGTFVYASSPRAAFDLVVAKHLGFGSAAEMDMRNSQVRAQNARNRDATRHAMNEMLRGNFSPLDALFGK